MDKLRRGAGYHSTDNEVKYKNICAAACRVAMKLLVSGEPALKAVTEAVKTLEDSPVTNAGYGSNLTLDGTIECDASVMDGPSHLFGAVGSLNGIKNPVQVAYELVRLQQKGLMSAGRLPPSILVGEGAKKWAYSSGIPEVSSCSLISDDAKRTYEKHKRKLSYKCSHSTTKKQKTEQQEDDVNGHCPIQDTVGAVCIDQNGDIASAVSSGGISLKHPGRIGPATVYGAGCWAENYSTNSQTKSGIATATSGSGEHLIRSLFAKECATCVQEAANASYGLGVAFQNKFLSTHEALLNISAQRYGGVIVLKSEKDDDTGEFLWGHTTESMCVGYLTECQSKAKTIISRLPDGKPAGESFFMQGQLLSFGQ